MANNAEVITKEAFTKFFDHSYGSEGNEELGTQAIESMSTEQIWDSIRRIDAELGN